MTQPDHYSETLRQAPVLHDDVQSTLESDACFRNFRRTKGVIKVIENVKRETGAQCLPKIKRYLPDFHKWKAELMRNDEIGNPKRSFYFSTGLASPTTVRFIKMLADIHSLVGGCNGARVVEIGPGYGGLCRMLNAYYDIRSYTMIDLPEMLELQKRYLGHFGVDNIQYVDATKFSENIEADLFISTYAFSEVNRDQQEDYIERVISHCTHGYMLYNRGMGYDLEEITQRLGNVHASLDDPHLLTTDMKKSVGILHW